MKAEDLKPHQRAQLSAIVTRHARFYYRLEKRVNDLNWPLNDPVFQRIVAASRVLESLRIFVDDIGKNPPTPLSTPGNNPPYVDDPNIPSERKRARLS